MFARWMRDRLAIFVFSRLHIHIRGNSNARIGHGQSSSAAYALSKDKDCVAILVASHFSEFILFFRTLQEQQVNVFCPTSITNKIYIILSGNLSQLEHSFDVCHIRYEGNRNMNNMVEEQPEYPETDSPVFFYCPYSIEHCLVNQ